ncbi:Hypothetical_protein [Hexamita inflata]|uniref:Hypothetical_protein n=1 Tax=Hexamita inflata TaxID=28002 RepID=A0AA86TVQ1_9EUKA|nr:Hypothetical protein HINF_LOCUS18134 [Hexamita inflata]
MSNSALIGYQNCLNWYVSDICVEKSLIIGKDYSGIISAMAFNNGTVKNIIIQQNNIQAYSDWHSYSGCMFGYIFSSNKQYTNIIVLNAKLENNTILSLCTTNITSYDTHTGVIVSEQARNTSLQILDTTIDSCYQVANQSCRKAFTGGYIGLTYGQVNIENSTVQTLSLFAFASDISLTGSIFAMIYSNQSQTIKNSNIKNITITSNSQNYSYAGGVVAQISQTLQIIMSNIIIESITLQSYGLITLENIIFYVNDNISLAYQLNNSYSKGQNIINTIPINNCLLINIKAQDGC